MKSIVIFTHSNDNQSIDDVAARVINAGIKVTRFDTDLYPSNYMIDAEVDNSGCRYCLHLPDGQQISADEVSGVWYRRFYIGNSIDQRMEAQIRNVCVEEATSAALGFLNCLDCFKLDCYWDVRRASIKEFQLKLAVKVGFDVPNTLVTNNGERSKKFYHQQKGNVVTKTQGSFGILKNGVEQVMYTTDVNEHDLDDIDSLKPCPMVFQEKIQKALELRVTVVGGLVFTAALDSSRYKSSSTDWRRMSGQTMEDWFVYQLPTEIEEKVLRYTKALNLNYGAIDILLTPDGRYVFLEINPCGEFYWIEKYVGHNICDAIAKLLIDSC